VRCSLARVDGHGTVRSMRELLILAIHLLVTFATCSAQVVFAPSPPSLFCSSISF
jgi:hypothetical protein